MNMIESRKPIKVNQAILKVMEYAVAGNVSDVPIEESYGHFLGEDLVADHHVPPFDSSAFDGFAIRTEDTYNATRKSPIQLEVIGEIVAGNVFDCTVGPMQAVRYMTGAHIPKGCRTVLIFVMWRERRSDNR